MYHFQILVISLLFGPEKANILVNPYKLSLYKLKKLISGRCHLVLTLLISSAASFRSIANEIWKLHEMFGLGTEKFCFMFNSYVFHI